MNARRITLTLVSLFLLPSLALAQFESHGIYEVGVASTDLGSDGGSATPIYGVGAGATYGVGSVAGFPLVLGGDLIIRGFGLEIPNGVNLDGGVFDQTDVWLDEFVALRLGSLLAGIYVEHRNIDRSRAGTIGVPTTGLGAIVEAGDRTKLRITYASTVHGRLRVDGVASEPDVASGQSARLTLTRVLTERWSGRVDVSYTNLELESTLPTLSFFDHTQTSFTLGLAVGF